MNNRIDGSMPRMLTGTPVGGVVHDLGKLIQIARFPVDIISRGMAVRAAGDLGSAIARTNASLERASALVRPTDSAHRKLTLDDLESPSAWRRSPPRFATHRGTALASIFGRRLCRR